MTDTLLDGVASARGDIGPGDVVLPSLGQKKHAGENSKNKEKPWRTIGDLRGYVFKQKSKVIKFANKLWWRSRRRDKTSSAIPGNVSFEIKGSGLNSQSPSRYHRSPYTAGVAIWDSKDDFQMGNETAYFDTLSPANFMSESLVERCHLRPAPILVKDLERFTGFTDGPDDDGVTPRQFVEVRLCSSQLKLPCVVAVFLVVNNPPEDLICGWQFLQDHNILPRFPYRASRGVLPITKGNPTAGMPLFAALVSVKKLPRFRS